MPLLDIFFSMLMFFLFFAWLWVLFTIFADIFRSDDLSGWGKAGWTILVIIIPLLGVLIYLIARGNSMQQRSMQQAADAAKTQQEYIRQAAGTEGNSAADQISQLADLRDKGALTDEEFQAQKAKILASA